MRLTDKKLFADRLRDRSGDFCDCQSWGHGTIRSTTHRDGFANNSVLMMCSEESKHHRRASWGFTLARLMEKFGEEYTMEASYEFFATLPIMVSKKPRCSNRVTW